MISIVNTECHVPKTFSDLAKIAAWGRLGQEEVAAMGGVCIIHQCVVSVPAFLS
jgi:hypothetical protein